LILEDPSHVGILEDPSQVGILEDPSQVGILEDPSQVGILEDPSQVYHIWQTLCEQWVDPNIFEFLAYILNI
jgi:hypothetical protein